MLRKLLCIIGVSGLLFAAPLGIASAADMPVKAPPPPPAWSWTGFYIGLNGGYGWGTNNSANNVGCSGPGICTYVAAGGFPPVQLTPNGFIGGGQIGYNWQVSNLVWGLEADFQGSGIKASGAQTVTPLGLVSGTDSLQEKLPWFGTVRGRLGIPVSNNWLLYATGGLIYGDVSRSSNRMNLFTGTTGTGSSSSVQDGWTLGSGTEVALAGRWTAKLEYLYFDLGRTSVTSFDAVAGTYLTVSQRMAGSILRAGLNYRF